MDAKSLCLGMLIQGEASGYEIRKAFEDGPFQHFFDVGYGSIYPALSRLAEDGLVSGRELPQDKRPDKKVYSITAKGRLAFVEALKEPPARDKLRSEFLFILAFAHLLPARHVAAVIDTRIEEVRATIDHMESEKCGSSSPCHAFVHGYGLTVYRAVLDYLIEHKHLLVHEALVSEGGQPSDEDEARPSAPGTE